MAGLTHMQKRCLDGIRALTVDGVCPSYDELRVFMGLASKSGVSRCVDALIDRRHLRRMPGHARSLEIVEQGVDPFSPASLDRLTSESLQRIADRCLTIIRARSA